MIGLKSLYGNDRSMMLGWVALKMVAGLTALTLSSSVVVAEAGAPDAFNRLQMCALSKVRVDFIDPKDPQHVETDGVNRLFGIMYNVTSDSVVEVDKQSVKIYDPNNIFLGKKVSKIMNFAGKQGLVMEFKDGPKDGIVFSTGPWPGRPGMMAGQVVQMKPDKGYNIDSYMFMGRCIPDTMDVVAKFESLRNQPATFSALVQ